MKLRFSNSLYPVYNLGPGKRIALWFQGCSIHCEGCLNPESWDFKGGSDVEVLDLILAIQQIAQDYDGITISGGEPFDQYDALIILCHMLKANTKLNILVFSGYQLSTLKEKYQDLHFLDVIDYLIDGPFQQDNYASRDLKGSTNQTMYHIVDSKCNLIDTLEFNPRWSLQVNNDHKAFLSGIPRKNEMHKLISLLHSQGIKWR